MGHHLQALRGGKALLDLGQHAIRTRLDAEPQLQATAIGHRLASGQALYRDVHTGVFPGVYWLVELLFRTFGTQVMVLRWTQLAVNTLIAVLLFLLARPLAPGVSAWLVPIGSWVLVILSFPVFTMLTYSPLSLLAALGALVFCRRYVEEARISDGIATGVLLGLSPLQSLWSLFPLWQ